ncbi:MAG: hypothetical protein HMLKMBBP_03741 [Planctomycetes bacterium]|nr:hypothetical protein [Planctomycetota bacterium]
MSTSSQPDSHTPKAPKAPKAPDAPSAPVRRPRRSAVSDLTVESLLESMKVSELQEIWEFWQNASKAPAKRGELLEGLHRALSDETVIGARVKLLTDRPREVLVRLLRADRFRAAVADLVQAGGTGALEAYEVEAAARALARRGFLRVERESQNGHGQREVYALPRDLGETIAALLLEERRGAKDVFSLRGFLASLAPAARGDLLDRLAVPPGPESSVDDVLAAVAAAQGADPAAFLDEGLRDAVRECANRWGGVAPRAQFDSLLPAGSPHGGKRLRASLESVAVGTVTSLDLSDYGFDLGGETVVLFPEVTEKILDAAPAPAESFDRTAQARVDLLTDLQQFLDLVATTPLRVTQGRSIYRAAQHRVLDVLVMEDPAIFPREQAFVLVYELAFGLELLEVDESSRLRQSRRGEEWHGASLTDKVRAIYGRFLEERMLDGRDFHARRLRRAVAAALESAPAGRWIAIDEVPSRVRNGYLAALDEQGVDEQYRNRFRYVYTPPRQTPAEATAALRDYMLTRLFPLGLVEVAVQGSGESARPVAVRMTDMGRRLVRGEPLVAPDAAVGAARCAPGSEPSASGGPPRPLVVNPDFEVILFPQGDVNDVAHRLDRFATRTKSDEVSHYRVTREGVERAVVKGMTADEIVEFLELFSRVPVPQNVAYSVREWASRVAFVRQREVVLLTAQEPEAIDLALSVDEVQRLLVERVSPTAAALRGRVTEWKTLESLRALGIHFKD